MTRAPALAAQQRWVPSKHRAAKRRQGGNRTPGRVLGMAKSMAYISHRHEIAAGQPRLNGELAYILHHQTRLYKTRPVQQLCQGAQQSPVGWELKRYQ